MFENPKSAAFSLNLLKAESVLKEAKKRRLNRSLFLGQFDAALKTGRLNHIGYFLSLFSELIKRSLPALQHIILPYQQFSVFIKNAVLGHEAKILVVLIHHRQYPDILFIHQLHHFPHPCSYHHFVARWLYHI